MTAPPTPAAASTRDEARAPALPGPREPLGPTLGYLRDPFGYLIRCARRYGDLFSVPTLLGRVVGCAHPDGVRELFAAPPGSFARWRPDFIVTATGESSLLISTGEQHRRDRKLLGPAFHGDRMRAYGQTMRDVALREAATWSPERPVRLHGAMLSISMEIILRTVFGADETTGLEPLRAAVLSAFERVTPARLLLGLVSSAFGGKGPYARFARMRAWVDPWLTGEIARRRQRESAGGPHRDGGDDILSLLVSARADDGATLSDQEIREQILTLLFAGHETVGSALAWALHLVASNPPVLARLLVELDALGDVPPAEALAAAPYLGAVCSETLRLYPPLPDVIRKLLRPMTVMGHDLPAGTAVAACIAAIHVRPDLFPEPTAFRPERFLERTYAPHEYLPFGGGDRRCIGSAFSLYQMKLVLGTLLARYRFELCDRKPVRPVLRNIATGPSGGVPALVRPRDSAPGHPGT